MEEYAVSEEIRSEEGWYVFIGMLMAFLVFSSIDVALKAGSVNGAMMWGRWSEHGITLRSSQFEALFHCSKVDPHSTYDLKRCLSQICRIPVANFQLSMYCLVFSIPGSRMRTY